METKTKFQEVLDGERNPSEVYAELLGEQEYIEGKISILKPLVLQELSNYSEKEVKLQGLTFQKKAAPGKWDYSNIPQWVKAKQNIKEFEQLAQQKFKSEQNGSIVHLADANGEEIPSPTYTSGAETFAVLKK